MDFFQNILKKRLGPSTTSISSKNVVSGIDPAEISSTTVVPSVNTIMEASTSTEHQTIYQNENNANITEVDINKYKDCKDIGDKIIDS